MAYRDWFTSLAEVASSPGRTVRLDKAKKVVKEALIAKLNKALKEIKEDKEAWIADLLAKAELIDKDKKAADEDPLGDFKEWLDPSN